MEILTCPGTRLVGESDGPEQRLETAFKHDVKSDSLQDAEHGTTDVQVERLTLDVGESQEVREIGDGLMFESFPASEGGDHGDMCSDFDVDGQNLPCNSHDSEDDNLGKIDHFAEAGLTIESSDMVLDSSESGLPDNNQEGSAHSDIKALEQDEPQAVWVKWRGKWQSGIRCARADWPLSTLKAKPTHGRKQYLVIFFPHTRNYSWADVLLVCPINEFPQPIAYKTHKVGMKMVKDLTLARRFIMQRLAVSMLNILDQLGREALIETARDVAVLKDFAMEASCCKDYSDLGKMLLKLQNMILPRCLNSEWLHQSLLPWKQRCQDANSAEFIEMLKEELADSILWEEVNSIASEALQVNVRSDWKNWKHEVMKLFSAWHPMSTNVGSDQPINDNPDTLEFQMTRKRPKLEVRRADVNTSGSHPCVPMEANSTFCDGYDVTTASLDSETKKESSIANAALGGSPGSVGNTWNDFVVEAGHLEASKSQDMESTPASSVSQKPVESGSRNRQCMAFIAAKGRQCVRYANEGDVYCCVHLATRFIANPAKAEAMALADSPMCGGTTVLGTKCKHRALIGSSFCKKHRPDDGKSTASPVNKLKRKGEENLKQSESKRLTNYVFSREAEDPVQLGSLLDMGKSIVQESSANENSEQLQQSIGSDEVGQCIGPLPSNVSEPCLEIPKRHSLYCEQHIPSWLKRARNGKSRIVSKEVFIELLKTCKSREQKLHLHQACEVFYRLFKSILSLRNPVPKEVQFQWAISEASKDVGVGEFLMKLVCNEKDRLKKVWGFEDGLSLQASATFKESIPVSDPAPVPVETAKDSDQENAIKCKICSEKFVDDEALGRHWMDSHKKESQWLFRRYVCAICLDSFTNKKVLEAHVQDRHHVEFVEQCMLLQCISCGSNIGNPDQLWSHVLSAHPFDLRLSNPAQQQDQSSRQTPVLNNSDTLDNVKSENQSVHHRRFICKFCGLKFDLLPDLGRHHQAAHMSQNSSGPRLTKKGIQFYVQKLKSGRLTRPRFKKGLSSASYTIRNRSVQNLKKRIQPSSAISPAEIPVQSSIPEVATLGSLADSQCSAVAQILMSELKGIKPHPSSSEILSSASSACCKISLQALLESKYGILPEKMYLKAAKLCSEHNIPVEWHQDDFICPRGCKSNAQLPILSPIEPLQEKMFKIKSSPSSNVTASEWTMDESHCIIDSRHFSMDLSEKNVVLCDDISFGQESLPIACVVDENLLNAEVPDGQISEDSFPWETFTYVTKSVLDQYPALESESMQLGCACSHSTCSSETCDHVYLFNNDYDDAKDIYGKSMRGRFPYDERGRIILEEGYVVYECNQRCRCSSNCRNRILQNGVRVKLEIFKTEKKGWAVRSREAILRGTFVCEYIGEVISEDAAEERRARYGQEGCKYLFEIDAGINDMGRMIEGQPPFVIDATNYGNISRYINHSCAPNLVNHQVLVESMDSHLAHIGFYASRDISPWEELTYDFRYKRLPGEGWPCLCGATNCRGRLC
ncbi:histone-lysine N-methyltransferase SUVR5 [Andrographis paniculata]|uniref:histone-lysine N-methyltransferase SUVR5 n=1 Tax=Andrographis paniculata TaxID=175694 RepID=UPI0021E8E69D|nr:histone-lysine N-methyltransferase SUVR5 [Andrographis paniculata]XP_051121072.1 histone-lysine N-methyltransferase SUVR5 [Andrographis paniculata]XP_051121073.1 histone-lysine N-methyltransferase SUVR5 [Andrographis paniculata]XP_051121074.1 histone-lysine N-methyltransferase SUVR5 [Andrographis paniculata]